MTIKTLAECFSSSVVDSERLNMFRFVSLLLLLIWSQDIIGHDVTEGTELVMSFLVHRHGDRTPVVSSLSYSTDPDALEALTAPYGYGQLTLAGRRRAYQLGKYIKHRYNELLTPKYNRSEVYIRSTDSTRSKMTVLAALAAIYPPVGEWWNKYIAWDPVPYTTVPAKYDFDLAFLNCPTFTEAYSQIYTTPAPELSAKYSDLLNLLSNELGKNITDIISVSSVYDVFVSQMSLGLDLGPTLNAAFPEIEAAADEAWGLIAGGEEYLHLEAGVLLNEFFTHSQQIINGEDTHKLRIYSAHDFNVYVFEAITKVKPQGAPKYASAYSLEVRKVTSTGEYVVLPVYLPLPGQAPRYLQVEGCDLLCNYEKFVELTEANALDESTWREECGFTDDLAVDDSSIG